MTNEELADMVDLALRMEAEQERIHGRPLHQHERRWLVAAGFRALHGSEVGDELADRILEILDEAKAAEKEI